MTEPTMNDLPFARFVGNEALKAQAATIPNVVAQFEAAGMQFNVKSIGWLDAAEWIKKSRASGQEPDCQHLEAVAEGRPYCHRFVAAGPEGYVYAVWEIYSPYPDSLNASKSRTIEVDADWQRKGIGSAFAHIIVSKLGATWSNRFTAAGARLKDRVEANLAQSTSSNSAIQDCFGRARHGAITPSSPD